MNTQKKTIKNCSLLLVLGLILAVVLFFLRFQGELIKRNVCLYASDACLIVGVFYLAAFFSCKVYQKGGFDGLLYVATLALKRLTFSKERKVDYSSFKARSSKGGTVGLLHFLSVGSGFLLAAVLFCLNFH